MPISNRCYLAFIWMILYGCGVKMKEINSVIQLYSISRRGLFASLFHKIADYKLSVLSTLEKINNQISCLFNRYKNECGCFVGGLFMGTSVIVTTIYFLISGAVTIN